MANYYTEFSFELVHLTEEQRAWMKDELETFEDDMECGYGFGWQFEEPGNLWIWADENGDDVEQAADFVEEFINRFGRDDVVTIEWANTCSRPVLGAFGGGAVVISKEGRRWINTADWSIGVEREIMDARERGVAQPG